MRCCSGLLRRLAPVVVLASTSAPAFGQNPLIESLTGRWSGWGSVTLAGGQTESVKCVATYTVGAAAGVIEQVLRCASASYRVDATARLDLRGEAVAGSWSERATSSTGAISGRASPAGLHLEIKGEAFTARAVLTATTCNHALAISPEGAAMARIAIKFERC
ncbi:MAG: hypothetical protein ACK4MF_00745 [Hyphomicrobiaceae bacterium]